MHLCMSVIFGHIQKKNTLHSHIYPWADRSSDAASYFPHDTFSLFSQDLPRTLHSYPVVQLSFQNWELSDPLHTHFLVSIHLTALRFGWQEYAFYRPPSVTPAPKPSLGSPCCISGSPGADIQVSPQIRPAFDHVTQILFPCIFIFWPPAMVRLQGLCCQLNYGKEPPCFLGCLLKSRICKWCDCHFCWAPQLPQDTPTAHAGSPRCWSLTVLCA